MLYLIQYIQSILLPVTNKIINILLLGVLSLLDPLNILHLQQASVQSGTITHVKLLNM